jgi:hypothetical protein
MKIGIFLWRVSMLQMKKREKVSDMARTAAFTVDVVEKGQAIPTSPVVSLEAWARGVNVSYLDCHWTKK